MKESIFFLILVFLVSIGIELAPAQSEEIGVEISGRVWATRNVGMPGTFTDNPENAGMLYQWNRNVGWSSTDPIVNSNGGTDWESNLLTGENSWNVERDPCPCGWRVPSYEEMNSLRGALNKTITINGVSGKVFGVAPNIVFLPSVGFRSRSSGVLVDSGERGVYWANSKFEYNTYRVYSLQFFVNFASGMTIVDDLNRPSSNLDAAHSIRCVKEDPSALSELINENIKVIGYYTLLGYQLAEEPPSGLFVILYDNGKVVKIFKTE